MADFSNHRRFTQRCLREDIMPVNIRLKSSIKTPKGHHIIRKAERALLNERVRLVNNTVAMLRIQTDTCIQHLENTLVQGEHGRMYLIHQGEERIKAFQDPRETKV